MLHILCHVNKFTVTEDPRVSAVELSPYCTRRDAGSHIRSPARPS